MLNGEKERTKFKLDKALIVLAINCVIIALIMIVLYLNNAKIQIFAKNANKTKESYTSTETNTWDISATANDNVIATLSDDGTLTISGTGEMKSFSYNSQEVYFQMKNNIKTVVIENGVTNIGFHAFKDCESLTSIQIATSVTNIGERAFEYCKNLTSIEIPDNITIIPNYLFNDCQNLVSVKMPKNLTHIYERAFRNCKKLTTIEIPESVISIGDKAFDSCSSLTDIKIPNNVINIGKDIFDYCPKLKKIEVADENRVYMDDNGVLYTKDGIELIKYPSDKEETIYTILSGTKIIKDKAFRFTFNLKNIEIPNTVIHIGENVFEYGKKLENIKIPGSVTYIGKEAFVECKYLKNVEIPKNVTNIGEGILKYSKIIEKVDSNEASVELIDILKRAQDVSDILYAEDGFELKNCKLDGTKVKINDNQLYGTIYVKSGKLTNLKYLIYKDIWDISATKNDNVIAKLSEDGTLSISGTGNMRNWYQNDSPVWRELEYAVNSVIINEGITNIGGYAFCGYSSLTNIEIPEGVTSIGKSAFYGCSSLISIEIPEGVTSIGNSAFYGCGSLTSIEIPEGVTSIEDDTFSRCSSLTSIQVDEKNPNYCDDNGVLYNKAKTKIIKYPQGKTETTYSILNGVTSIGYEAFEGCSSLTSIEIPSSVTSIKSSAFERCSSLRSIKIKGIQPQTAVKQLKDQLKFEKDYEVINNLGEVLEDTAYIGTGNKIKLNNDSKYTLIVKGDLNGDGDVKLSDLSKLKLFLVGSTKLEGAYEMAADLNGDGKVKLSDLSKMKLYLVGKSSL